MVVRCWFGVGFEFYGLKYIGELLIGLICFDRSWRHRKFGSILHFILKIDVVAL